MFLSEMSEAKQELIEIKDFDGDAIQDLVHFAYSSKLTLTVDNVQPLLYAACILQVQKAISIKIKCSYTNIFKSFQMTVNTHRAALYYVIHLDV